MPQNKPDLKPVPESVQRLGVPVYHMPVAQTIANGELKHNAEQINQDATLARQLWREYLAQEQARVLRRKLDNTESLEKDFIAVPQYNAEAKMHEENKRFIDTLKSVERELQTYNDELLSATILFSENDARERQEQADQCVAIIVQAEHAKKDEQVDADYALALSLR